MENNIMDLFSGLNTGWVLLGAALVFFMQAGFAMVESGFTRAKNAGNIIMKNLMDFAIGTPLYWLVGFGIMFGGSGLFFGAIDFFGLGDYSAVLPAGVGKSAYFIFQTVFCATAATIVSGAMAERTKFSAYCIYSAAISLFVYPLSGHWIWGGGWLTQLPELTGGALPAFHDFAGSTAVHMVGGVAALVGAKILGPRIGKYGKDGKSHAIPGHSITLGALGVFILWFCWFGFNGASTVSMTDGNQNRAGEVFFNTNLAAAVATVSVMFITWVRYKKPDVSMTLNGSLAGLVAITAGCDRVDPFGAAVIGIFAGFAVVFGVEFIDKKLKIDDPVGAVGVHGICGASGTILLGFFDKDIGLFYGGGAAFLLSQLIGVVCVIAWVGLTMTLIFTVIRKTVGLRVTREEEISGLDLPEHGLASAYAGFAPVVENIYYDDEDIPAPAVTGGASMNEAVPVELVTGSESSMPPVASDEKITKIDIVCKQSSFEHLKNALMAVGITGMTVTNVLGCGIQKGKPEYYRGVQTEATLLPKIQIEIVVCRVPVRTVIGTAKKALYTGHIGDGKIFVYDVENVVKVRTGEEGAAALQDVE